MAEENQVTGRKLAEENQVTTKNLKKVEVGRRLAEYNRRKREELKVQKSKQVEPMLDSSTCYGIGALLDVGVIGGLGFLLLPSQSQCRASSATFTSTP